MKLTSEAAFETVIETHLLANGYVRLPGDGFDGQRAIFPAAAIEDLCKWLDAEGALATLRHGFKCYGRTLRIAVSKAAHELNPELEARYATNRLGLTRQLRFSPGSGQALDVTLSLNGIPIVTIELKNPLSRQTVEDACAQYRQDRDPREPIFAFKRRTLVHFARVRWTVRPRLAAASCARNRCRSPASSTSSTSDSAPTSRQPTSSSSIRSSRPRSPTTACDGPRR